MYIGIRRKAGDRDIVRFRLSCKLDMVFNVVREYLGYTVSEWERYIEYETNDKSDKDSIHRRPVHEQHLIISD